MAIHKFNKVSRFKFLTWVVLVICGVIIGYFSKNVIQNTFSQNMLSNHSQEKVTLCASDNLIAQTIKESFPDKQKYKIENFQDEANKHFLWRLSESQPYIFYHGTNASTIYLYDQDIDEVASIFQSTIISQLNEKGFYIDKVITHPLQVIETPFEGNNINFIYGLIYKDEVYRIEGSRSMYDGTNSLPAHTIGIQLACGKKNKLLEKQYDQLLQTQKYTSNDAIDIWQAQDNLLVVNKTGVIGGIACCSGVANYWNTKTLPWELMAETQELISCDFLEGKKIGKGVNCYDSKIQKNREAK